MNGARMRSARLPAFMVLAWGGVMLAGCSASPRALAKVEATPTGNPFRIGRPLVIAHAGGDGLLPENTLYAYEHSMEMGGDVIDADVFLTADGVSIAFHDSTLERTTNGTGRVEDKSYAELATLDAAWNFELDGEHSLRGKGIAIPTIEAILRRFPHTLVTLDLKDLRSSAVEPPQSKLRTQEQRRTRQDPKASGLAIEFDPTYETGGPGDALKRRRFRHHRRVEGGRDDH